MRFSTTAVLALPLLASAAESPFEQYKAKFQNFLGSFGASAPVADKAAAPAAAAVSSAAAAAKAAGKAKKVAEPKPVTVLTLENWKDTLFAPVQASATQPEEWLVLVTGGNKTCFGHCSRLEAAFAEAATPFASLPASQSPHLASVNCDEQTVLCNAWSANAGVLWIYELLPAPAPVEIYTQRLNLTTVTAKDVVDAYKASVAEGKTAAGWNRYDPDGYFHPFEGKLAKLGLALPLGYFFWALNAVPSWAMMLFVSFISRSMMSRRTEGMARGAPGAGAPRAAPAGDARS